MGDHVYLVSDLGEIHLGTIVEIQSGKPSCNAGGPGQSFSTILSDIVSDLSNADECSTTLTIEIR